MSISLPPRANGILGQLAEDELDRLMPHLEPVHLVLRQKLALPHQPITHIYFMQSGINSQVTSVRNDVPVEIGIVGREGIVNLAALLGADRTPSEAMVQVAGRALRLDVDRARSAVEQGPSFNKLVRQSAYLFMAQTSATVLANARGTVSQRLARWLLMVRDRLDDDALPLTHEFISFMLGVRRPTVTHALTSFEAVGWIARRRGEITLLDRKALLDEADGFYGAAEQEVRRLQGTFASSIGRRVGCSQPRIASNTRRST